MSSRTTRGYWKLGAVGCRGASWSKEADDKEPRSAWSTREKEPRISHFLNSIITSPARASSFICYTVEGYAYFIRLSKLL